MKIDFFFTPYFLLVTALRFVYTAFLKFGEVAANSDFTWLGLFHIG